MTNDLEPLDPELDALLARARRRDSEDPAFDREACERLLARVEREIGAGTSASPAASFMARLGISTPFAAACAAVAMAGAVAASTRGPNDVPAVVEHTEPVTAAPVVEPPTAVDDEVASVSVHALPSLDLPTSPGAAPAAKQAASNSARKATDAPTMDLAAELEMIDAARAAVAKRQNAEALQKLAQHEARFPNGQLAQQRDRLRIQALVAMGDRDQARARAATFRKQYPNGLLLPAVERALEGGNTDAP